MKFQLSYNNLAEILVLPVNPPEYSLTGGGTDFNDFSVVKGGAATAIGNDKFTTVTFSSYFPRDYSSLCEYTDIPKPWEAVHMIERWRKTKWPIRLIITGDADINMPVTIRKFDYREIGGQPGDVSFDIQLTEYRFIVIRDVAQGQSSAPKAVASEQRPTMAQSPKTYVVASGDCLWNIAKRIYGNGADWPKIYNANKSIIGADPNVIKTGQKLVIP